MLITHTDRHSRKALKQYCYDIFFSKAREAISYKNYAIVLIREEGKLES